MLLLVIAFLAASSDIDLAWSRLSAAEISGDKAAFASERTRIIALDDAALIAWGAQSRESFEAAGYRIKTYSGPAHVHSVRSQARYFAIVEPTGDLQQPTLWEMQPADPILLGQEWVLSVAGCDFKAGDSLIGHPKYWRTASLQFPPAYGQFKQAVSEALTSGDAFPADTLKIHIPDTACLYVGNVSFEKTVH